MVSLDRAIDYHIGAWVNFELVLIIEDLELEEGDKINCLALRGGTGKQLSCHDPNQLVHFGLSLAVGSNSVKFIYRTASRNFWISAAGERVTNSKGESWYQSRGKWLA